MDQVCECFPGNNPKGNHVCNCPHTLSLKGRKLFSVCVKILGSKSFLKFYFPDRHPFSKLTLPASKCYSTKCTYSIEVSHPISTSGHLDAEVLYALSTKKDRTLIPHHYEESNGPGQHTHTLHPSPLDDQKITDSI